MKVCLREQQDRSGYHTYFIAGLHLVSIEHVFTLILVDQYCRIHDQQLYCFVINNEAARLAELMVESCYQSLSRHLSGVSRMVIGNVPRLAWHSRPWYW